MFIYIYLFITKLGSNWLNVKVAFLSLHFRIFFLPIQTGPDLFVYIFSLTVYQEIEKKTHNENMIQKGRYKKTTINQILSKVKHVEQQRIY